jgi:hypothetical protein
MICEFILWLLLTTVPSVSLCNCAASCERTNGLAGYWNLENSDTEWTPPADLEAFMAKAKEDGKALVYIVSISTLCYRTDCSTHII